MAEMIAQAQRAGSLFQNFGPWSRHLPATCSRLKDIESPVNPETLKEEQK